MATETQGSLLSAYEAAKKANPEALVIIRMGDFYELFHDDAREASKILGLSMTARGKGDTAVPMAGFPYHQLDASVKKLVASGKRVVVE
jgi:DNA mismatch repair protein MutS